jgi:chromosome partitioning protein
VVQPTRASVDDLRPAVREFHALVQADIPTAKLVFALNRIQAGYAVLDGCLLERPAYRKAQNVGHSITETSYRNLNVKADALIQALINGIEDNNGRSIETKETHDVGRAAAS